MDTKKLDASSEKEVTDGMPTSQKTTSTTKSKHARYKRGKKNVHKLPKPEDAATRTLRKARTDSNKTVIKINHQESTFCSSDNVIPLTEKQIEDFKFPEASTPIELKNLDDEEKESVKSLLKDNFRVAVFKPSLEAMADSTKLIKFIISVGAHQAGGCKIIPPQGFEFVKEKWTEEKINNQILKEYKLQTQVIQYSFKDEQEQVLHGLGRHETCQRRFDQTVERFRELKLSGDDEINDQNDNSGFTSNYFGKFGKYVEAYASDQHCSLLNPNDAAKEWDLGNFDKEGVMKELGIIANGVSSTYVYYGLWRAMFVWHVEDGNLFSINYHHYGADKNWFFIPLKDAKRFEEDFGPAVFPKDFKDCPRFFKMKQVIAHPGYLDQFGISWDGVTQSEGEIIITFPHDTRYHSGYNKGFNVNEAVNFIRDPLFWVQYFMYFQPCVCEKANLDFIYIDPRPIVKKLFFGNELFFPEPQKAEKDFQLWLMGLFLWTHPDEEEEGVVPCGPFESFPEMMRQFEGFTIGTGYKRIDTTKLGSITLICIARELYFFTLIPFICREMLTSGIYSGNLILMLSDGRVNPILFKYALLSFVNLVKGLDEGFLKTNDNFKLLFRTVIKVLWETGLEFSVTNNCAYAVLEICHNKPLLCNKESGGTRAQLLEKCYQLTQFWRLMPVTQKDLTLFHDYDDLPMKWLSSDVPAVQTFAAFTVNAQLEIYKEATREDIMKSGLVEMISKDRFDALNPHAQFYIKKLFDVLRIAGPDGGESSLEGSDDNNQMFEKSVTNNQSSSQDDDVVPSVSEEPTPYFPIPDDKLKPLLRVDPETGNLVPYALELDSDLQSSLTLHPGFKKFQQTLLQQQQYALPSTSKSGASSSAQSTRPYSENSQEHDSDSSSNDEVNQQPKKKAKNVRVAKANKPYKCTYENCDRGFQSTKTLKSHIRDFHIKKSICDVCKIQFSNEAGLIRHTFLRNGTCLTADGRRNRFTNKPTGRPKKSKTNQ